MATRGWKRYAGTRTTKATTLKASVERYREDTGKYPKRILADKIFRNRENLAWCKERGIRLNGPRLGRPPKDRAQYLEERAWSDRSQANETRSKAVSGCARAGTAWILSPCG